MSDGHSATAPDAGRFAAIVACSSDAIISKTLDGIVETWNPAAESLFGWTAAEIIGTSVTRIIPAHLIAEEEQILARIRQGELVPRFETERVAKDGELIPIAITVSPVRGENGEVIGASKIATDLRPQRKLDSDLHRASNQFTALANNIPQLAWIADKDGWIYWFNKRWHDYTGTTPEEMEGWGWRKVHHPDHVDRVVEKIQQAWDTGEAWEDTFPLRRHDGAYRWFLSRANPLKDDAGRVILWCGSNTDITEELEAKNHIAMLMREVNHRSRNMLAVMQAMINRSRYDTTGELAQALIHRIDALKSNQQILNGGDWSGAKIADIVSAQVSHIDQSDRHRIHLEGGEDLAISVPHAEALGLAIHELATNAEKYGALAVDGGRVDIRWNRATAGDGQPCLQISWTERGAKNVTKPARTGFGTMLIRNNVEHAFGGEVDLEYREDGIRWSVECAADDCLIDTIEQVEAIDYL